MNKGENGGDVERYFDIHEVPTTNGRGKFKLVLVDGPPVDDPSRLIVSEEDAPDPRYGRFYDYLAENIHPGYVE